jgi:hypothetical protein
MAENSVGFTQARRIFSKLPPPHYSPEATEIFPPQDDLKYIPDNPDNLMVKTAIKNLGPSFKTAYIGCRAVASAWKISRAISMATW